MVIANKEKLGAGYQFRMGVEESGEGTTKRIKNCKFTVIRHYKHFVLVKNEADMRDTILNADLMIAGIINNPFQSEERVDRRQERIPTGAEKYKNYRKEFKG
jgi:hypothetical protein